MNIDPMVWRLSEAHPRLRPQWLRDRMVPIVHPKKYIRNMYKPKRKILPSQQTEDKPVYPSISRIVEVVCNRHNVSHLDIVSERRTRHVVRARQIAIYLSKKLTPHSYPAIARRFGGRDHTTAMASVWRVEELIAKDHEFAEVVDAARSEVVGSAWTTL